jgi:hypothetical protein
LLLTDQTLLEELTQKLFQTDDSAQFAKLQFEIDGLMKRRYWFMSQRAGTWDWFIRQQTTRESPCAKLKARARDDSDKLDCSYLDRPTSSSPTYEFDKTGCTNQEIDCIRLWITYNFVKSDENKHSFLCKARHFYGIDINSSQFVLTSTTPDKYIFSIYRADTKPARLLQGADFN